MGTANWQVTFDCAEPRRLAEFWCEALGYAPAPPPAGWSTWEEWLVDMNVPEEEWDDGATIADPDGVEPPLTFLKVPEGKVAKNRLHLDLRIGGGRARPYEERWPDVVAAKDRLTALGATVHLEVAGGDGRPDHFVMHDPEGNEFCLV